jgi:hypothetical protein
LDPCKYELDHKKEDTFLSINGSEFGFVGNAVVSLASGKKLTFVVASDLVHKKVLGIHILDNAMLHLAHGLAVIAKLAFEGQLERGGLGGIFAVCKQTAAGKYLEELLDKYAELSCAMEPVDIRLNDPDKFVWVPPRRLSQREEQSVDDKVNELLNMDAITRSTSPFNTPIVVVEHKGNSRAYFDFRELNKHVENSHYPLPLLER